MAASAASWIKVHTAMRAFIGGTFIESDCVPFGVALPKDDANWHNAVQQKIAA
jgi:hypothetical protein